MMTIETVRDIRSSAAELNRFIAATISLRNSQREYYRSKDQNVLRKARALEKQVDDFSKGAITAVSNILKLTN